MPATPSGILAAGIGISGGYYAILAIAGRKMADLYARGIRAIVDLTTVDLGRDIDLIVDVAAARAFM